MGRRCGEGEASLLLIMDTSRRFKILFLCTGNSARSIFAEYLLRKIAPAQFEVFSAGASPKSKPHPLAIQVLHEMYDVDASDARCKSWDEFKAVPFDFVVTLCDSARELCPVWPGQPILAHWGSPDPAESGGALDEQARLFWQVAQQICRRVELFALLPFAKLDALRLAVATRDIGDRELLRLPQSL
ncbi:arsenate reductase ArsC [soil metagenome]